MGWDLPRSPTSLCENKPLRTKLSPSCGMPPRTQARAREAWPAPVGLPPVAHPLACHFRLLYKANRQICLLPTRAELPSHSVPSPWAAESPARRPSACLPWFHSLYTLCRVHLPGVLLPHDIPHCGLWHKICSGTAPSGHIRAPPMTGQWWHDTWDSPLLQRKEKTMALSDLQRMAHL